MYVGVRAGGGIGDEIEDPAGDEYEIYRIIFDITFFFFVIVILLAIIQGKLTGSQEDLESDLLIVEANIKDSIFPKQHNSRKTSTSASLTMLKPLTVWITTNCGKLLNR